MGIYPILPSLFDLALSTTDLDFDSILDSRRGKELKDAAEEKAEEGETSIRSRKKQMEKALEDLED
jgi:hypothetical protein